MCQFRYIGRTMTMSSVIAIILGPFIGSFLGVLITRLPEGRPLVLARSACPYCATRLGPVDLVPLLSWLVMRRRCRHCGAAVSTFYPLIELGGLAVPVWAAFVTSGWIMFATCVLGWALLALAVIDWRHMVLPNSLTLPLIPAGLMVAAGVDPAQVVDHALGAVLGFIVFVAIAWLYRRVRDRDGLGHGDAKLLAAGGAWVGWMGLSGIVLIAAVSGLIVALAKRIRGKSLSMADRLAFGPYLCLGIWMIWLYGPIYL